MPLGMGPVEAGTVLLPPAVAGLLELAGVICAGVWPGVVVVVGVPLVVGSWVCCTVPAADTSPGVLGCDAC